jgi:hypothetical protein
MSAQPGKLTAKCIARAIDMKNVAAWRDEEKRLHVAVSP